MTEEDIQISRLMDRNNLALTEAKKRIKAHMSLDKKAERSHFGIKNLYKFKILYYPPSPPLFPTSKLHDFNYIYFLIFYSDRELGLGARHGGSGAGHHQNSHGEQSPLEVEEHFADDRLLDHRRPHLAAKQEIQISIRN